MKMSRLNVCRHLMILGCYIVVNLLVASLIFYYIIKLMIYIDKLLIKL